MPALDALLLLLPLPCFELLTEDTTGIAAAVPDDDADEGCNNEVPDPDDDNDDGGGARDDCDGAGTE